VPGSLPHPHAVDGERGQHDAALEDLQDRAEAGAVRVRVNRVGGDFEALTKFATATQGCLLLEWDVTQYG
jgi:hypothetical protein